MARKPISESNIALNCIKWGVGGINIDECRVKTNDDLARVNKVDSGMFGVGNNNNNNNNAQKCKEAGIDYGGRFPANVITDGSDEVASGMPYTKSEGGSGEASTTKYFSNINCGSHTILSILFSCNVSNTSCILP